MRKWKFTSVLCLFLVMWTTTITTGCISNWVPQAIAIVDALLPAVTSILNLVGAFKGGSITDADYAVVNQIAREAKTDLSQVKSLLDQYNAAPDADKQSVLGKVNVAIGAVQADLNKILPALHIKDQALQSKINAIVGIVIAEVQSLIALLPVIQGKATVRAGPPVKLMHAKEFKATYNDALTTPTGNVLIDTVTPQFAVR